MIWSPTVNTGFNDVIGSWNTMATSRPRTCRIWSLVSLSRSMPSNRISPPTISPGGLSMSRMIERAVTLLPDPDSPTIARRAAAAHREADAVDRLDGAVHDLEVRPQVADVEEDVADAGAPGPLDGSLVRGDLAQIFALGSRASCRPSPMKLMPSTMITMAAPGKKAHHQLPTEMNCSEPPRTLPSVGVSRPTPYPR